MTDIFHVSSNLYKRWLLLCYLRVPFHQLASPPRFNVAKHPEGEPYIYEAYIYIKWLPRTPHARSPRRNRAVLPHGGRVFDKCLMLGLPAWSQARRLLHDSVGNTVSSRLCIIDPKNVVEGRGIDFLTEYLFSERTRLAPPWPLTISHLNTASVFYLLDRSSFSLISKLFWYFRFLVFFVFFSLILCYCLCIYVCDMYVKPAANNT